MKHCVVAGGGLAGLAAALRLSASPGLTVTLCESAPALGGRARSFTDRQSGLEIDNGQHVLMGCYRATLRYLEEAGTTVPPLRRMKGLALPFVHRDGRSAVLQAGSLPHPLSLVQAFLRYDILPVMSRLRILRVSMCLRRLHASDPAALDAVSAGEWLRACGQRQEEIRHFWRPVILATMNAEAEQTSARLFAVVLREIFLGPADAADMLLPETGLSPLLIDPARRTLEARGVRIHTGSGVTAVSVVDAGEAPAEGADTRRVSGVRCGETAVPADAVILAVPPWALQRIEVSGSGAPIVPFAAERFAPSEILSIHIWCARDLGGAPMTGMLGTTLQWVFFKGKTGSSEFHYSCTVSAARGDETADETAMRTMLLQELRLLDAGLRDEEILRILPIREKRATFTPAPGLDPFRPGPRTSINGLLLAGDWTATGLPATIEGAIRSGQTAADLLLEDPG